eukprot:GHVS01093786.1.p1 GENE.GHVS01093786.1~~GHVS01093786.1.p1  ORF type:complete len:544 (+),score=88.76 GHVS01093786.1:399-2030(+)
MRSTPADMRSVSSHLVACVVVLLLAVYQISAAVPSVRSIISSPSYSRHSSYGLLSSSSLRSLGQKEVPSSFFLHCPVGYHWEHGQCIRILKQDKIPRCPAGQLNDSICLYVVRPLSRVCPPNYIAQDNTCVRTRTAAKVLVCTPLSKLKHHHTNNNSVCVKYHHLPIGYSCQRGTLRAAPKATDQTHSGIPLEAKKEEDGVEGRADGEKPVTEETKWPLELDQSQACVAEHGVRKSVRCPEGFTVDQSKCTRVRHYPCDDQPQQVDASSRSALSRYDGLALAKTMISASDSFERMSWQEVEGSEGGMPNNENVGLDVRREGGNMRRLVGKQTIGSDGIQQELCWDKQTVAATIMCPLDAELVDDICLARRYYPLVPKCAGVISQGKCVTTSITKPMWKCPLDFPHFGASLPSEIEQQGRRRRLHSYPPPRHLLLKKKNKETPFSARLDPPWLSEEGGYCHRSKYANFALECPNGFRAHLSTGTCRQRLTPVYICTHGYEVTEHGCVKTEFVEPIVSPREPIRADCLNKRCSPSLAAQLQISSQ